MASAARLSAFALQFLYLCGLTLVPCSMVHHHQVAAPSHGLQVLGVNAKYPVR